MKIRQILDRAICYLLLAISSLPFAVPKAAAQTPSCLPIYGGGQTCTIHTGLSINKQIQAPNSLSFKDNITSIDSYFTSNQVLIFRIIVKNISEKTLANIAVSDTLPAVLNYKSGNGQFNFTTHTFSDQIITLNKEQSKTYAVITTINAANLPTDSTFCGVNQATVTQNGISGSDNATFCIDKEITNATQLATQTKGGLPIYNSTHTKKTPSTGPEDLALISLPSLAGLGYYLRRKLS
jgi:uncharacterized repeat protein (TIGR01451 family)